MPSAAELETPTSISPWEKWHDWMAAPLEPVTRWFCRATALAEGDRVLDIACGTGLPALQEATAVGPTGTVLAVDVDEAMLGATRRNAARAGLANLDVTLMNAEALQLDDGSFDVATCAFGLMFCREDVALRQIHRVLRPHGRFALAVWAEPEANPFFSAVFGALRRLQDAPPPSPGAPGPFRLSAPGVLETALQDSGLSDFEIERVEVVFEFESVERHFEIMSEMMPPVRNALAEPAVADRVRDALRVAVEPFTAGGRVRLPATARCASGRKD